MLVVLNMNSARSTGMTLSFSVEPEDLVSNAFAALMSNRRFAVHSKERSDQVQYCMMFLLIRVYSGSFVIK